MQRVQGSAAQCGAELCTACPGLAAAAVCCEWLRSAVHCRVVQCRVIAQCGETLRSAVWGGAGCRGCRLRQLLPLAAWLRTVKSKMAAAWRKVSMVDETKSLQRAG